MFDIPLYLYQGTRPPAPKLYDYILAEQGLIKRVSNRLVEVETLLLPFPAASPLTGLRLAPYPLQPAQLKLPRLPGDLLRQALEIARQDLSQEAMFQLVYNAAGYRLLQPRQTREDIWVRYTTHPQPDDLLVLDLHSHHTMPASFSPQDDRDEKGGRFYAVMGRLNQPQPHLALRLGLYGHWLPLDPATLFTDITPFAPAPSLDEAWQVSLSPEKANDASGSFLRRFLPERWTV